MFQIRLFVENIRYKVEILYDWKIKYFYLKFSFHYRSEIIRVLTMQSSDMIKQ